MDDVEEFQNGRVYLKIKHLTHPIHNEYWLQIGGVMGLQVREDEWNQLCELIAAYNEEINELFNRKESKIERGFKWLKTLWKSETPA